MSKQIILPQSNSCGSAGGLLAFGALLLANFLHLIEPSGSHVETVVCLVVFALGALLIGIYAGHSLCEPESLVQSRFYDDADESQLDEIILVERSSW